MNDVAIDRSALEQAKLVLDAAIGNYSVYAEDTWRRDTGIGDPCGRTHLRVTLENTLGAALARIRSDVDDAHALAAGLQSVLDAFTELDASLGKGWNRDYVADLS